MKSAKQLMLEYNAEQDANIFCGLIDKIEISYADETSIEKQTKEQLHKVIDREIQAGRIDSQAYNFALKQLVRIEQLKTSVSYLISSA